MEDTVLRVLGQEEPGREHRSEGQRRKIRAGHRNHPRCRWAEVCVAKGFVAESTQSHRVGICIIKNMYL